MPMPDDSWGFYYDTDPPLDYLDGNNEGALKLRFKKVEEGVYDTYYLSVHLGTIRKNDDGSFWSYAPWSIDGEPCPLVTGGVLGKTSKRSGYARRTEAARRLAVMQSAAIIKSISVPAL